MKVNLKGNKGFSLVELIIVIAILGILAAISIAAFQGVLGRSREKADSETAAQIKRALTTYITESEDIYLSQLKEAAAAANLTSTSKYSSFSAAPTTKAQMDQILVALQKRVTILNNNGSEKFGPYLEAKEETPKADSYYPQSKTNVAGWEIVLKAQSGGVRVEKIPASTATATITGKNKITVSDD